MTDERKAALHFDPAVNPSCSSSFVKDTEGNEEV
jgi:hypothetical protein